MINLLLLNFNVIHTSSDWFCWKAQEKSQVKSRFCKTMGSSYVNLLTTYLVKRQKKTMFKVSNRNTRKGWLISKIILKTSERRHLTTSYLPEVTVQNHILGTVFPRIYTNLQSKVCFQFCFKVLQPVISTIADPYMSFYEKLKIITEIWFMKYSKCQDLLFLKKQPKKWINFSTFYLFSISVSQS